MPRTVERHLHSVLTFDNNKPKRAPPSLINLPPVVTNCKDVQKNPVSTSYLTPNIYEAIGPIQRITAQYDQYVANDTNATNGTDDQNALAPQDPNDLLSNIQLQMMYVVDSQRGSPALFVVKGWLSGDNSRWFDCIVRNDPVLSNTMDLRKNGYQPMPEFDTVLQTYNALVHDYSPTGVSSPILLEGRQKQWKPPTEMKWTMVGIENHTLVLWVGPHRVISQPGHTTHIYIHPKPRHVLIDKITQHPELCTMMELIRLRLGTTSSNYALFPLPSDPPMCKVEHEGVERENARNAIVALRERSWAAIHYKRDPALSREFFHTEDTYVNRYLTKASAVAACCAKVQPTIFAIWGQLYTGMAEQSSHCVSFPPTQYTQHQDDDTSPFFPPHIDYKAVF
jgi:hypothetical protein